MEDRIGLGFGMVVVPRASDRPGTREDAKGPHRRGERDRFDAVTRRGGKRADRPGGAEQRARARVPGRHGEAKLIGIGGDGRPVRVEAHADRRQAKAVGAPTGDRVGAAEGVRHGFERLHDAAVVGGVDDRRAAVGDVVRFDALGTAAIELGEIRQDAGADARAGESGAKAERRPPAAKARSAKSRPAGS